MEIGISEQVRTVDSPLPQTAKRPRADGFAPSIAGEPGRSGGASSPNP